MKLKIIFSLLFFIATTFTAIHEVEHIISDEASSCLVCTINHNLVSADVIDLTQSVEIVHFDKITKENFIFALDTELLTNPSRAPPIKS